MTPGPIDDLGPIDYLVVEFAAGQNNFTGEMARELAVLVESGTMRVLDILILLKDDDGSIGALEIDDLDVLDEMHELERDIAEILATKDVAHLTEAMENGSTAGVVVWENRWAAPFGAAARRAGGQLIAHGHIPIQSILASLESDDELEPEAEAGEFDVSLRPVRAARRGVLAAPVARTTATVGAVAVVANGVSRRQYRRGSRRVLR